MHKTQNTTPWVSRANPTKFNKTSNIETDRILKKTFPKFPEQQLSENMSVQLDGQWLNDSFNSLLIWFSFLILTVQLSIKWFVHLLPHQKILSKSLIDQNINAVPLQHSQLIQSQVNFLTNIVCMVIKMYSVFPGAPREVLELLYYCQPHRLIHWNFFSKILNVFFSRIFLLTPKKLKL